MNTSQMTKNGEKDPIRVLFPFMEQAFGNELVTFRKQQNADPAVQRFYI